MNNRQANEIKKATRWTCPKCKRSLPSWISREHMEGCDGTNKPTPARVVGFMRELNKIN